MTSCWDDTIGSPRVGVFVQSQVALTGVPSYTLGHGSIRGGPQVNIGMDGVGKANRDHNLQANATRPVEPGE